MHVLLSTCVLHVFAHRYAPFRQPSVLLANERHILNPASLTAPLMLNAASLTAPPVCWIHLQLGEFCLRALTILTPSQDQPTPPPHPAAASKVTAHEQYSQAIARCDHSAASDHQDTLVLA
jgi:Na+-transporting NADH:ubiquinone oxidoreductase subunit NqrB